MLNYINGGGWKHTAFIFTKNFKLIKMVTINGKQYLTLHEYAKYKDVTIQTVYNHIKDKKVETRELMNMTLIKM